jgi:uncharacterized protein (UPF0276 family)
MASTPRFGLGFRKEHFADLLAAPQAVDWLELLSESWLCAGGARRAMLEQLRGRFPLTLHGVSLNLASDRGPRADYLARLRALADWLEPVAVSDHLCWTGLGGVESHDLLPVAHTREVLDLVCARVSRVQDALGRRILLENASAYVAFRADDMSEAEFFAALCSRTGCGMLLDVNNLFVNASNLGTDPDRVLAAIAPEHVGYLHVAGHAALPGLRIDTHGAPVADEVWALCARAVRRFPHAGVILERDTDLPPLSALLRELERARTFSRISGASEAETARRAAAIRAVEVETSAVRAEAGPLREPEDPGGSWPALRQRFWERLVDKPLRFDHDGSAGLGELLDIGRPLAPARGMRVYSDAYAEMGRQALAAHFPALAQVTGERAFAALAAAYLAAHPSRSHDYVALGADLPNFLRASSARCAGVAREALAELAALEQAQLEVQEANDAAARVTPEMLLLLLPEDWERVRFRFADAFRVVRCTHDVLPALAATARGEPAPRPARRRVAYLVTRDAGRPLTDPLDPQGADILAGLAEGASFAEACRAPSDLAPDGEAAAVEAGMAALGLACARGAVCELLVTG